MALDTLLKLIADGDVPLYWDFDSRSTYDWSGNGLGGESAAERGAGDSLEGQGIGESRGIANQKDSPSGQAPAPHSNRH